MLKSEIISGLRRSAEGADWISQKQISQYLGVRDKSKARGIVHGLARIGTRYYIPEVAERIMMEVRR